MPERVIATEKAKALVRRLEGEFGVNKLFVGVLAKIGSGGIEKIMPLEMTEEEKAAFQKSAGAVKELVDAMAKMPK